MPFSVIAFSPDSRWFAAGAFYKAFAWEIGTGDPVPNADISTDRPVTALAFSPDSRFFAAGSTDGFVHIKNLETGDESNQPPATYGVDITTGQEVTTDITGHADEVSGLVFSPDSQMLVSSSNDQTFIAWDTGHWPVFGPANVQHAPIIGVAFNPTTSQLASMDTNGTVILWDLSKSSRLYEFTDNDQFPLEQASGEPLSPEECQSLVNQPESSCVVSPDGKLLISSSPQESYGAYLNTRTPDSLMQLWDFETKQLIGQFVARAFQPESFVFSADYKYLRILGQSDGKPFFLISLDVPSWVSTACAVANRNFSEGEWGRYLGGMEYRTSCQ
jgi:WD40 repeat protein